MEQRTHWFVLLTELSEMWNQNVTRGFYTHACTVATGGTTVTLPVSPGMHMSKYVGFSFLLDPIWSRRRSPDHLVLQPGTRKGVSLPNHFNVPVGPYF